MSWQLCARVSPLNWHQLCRRIHRFLAAKDLTANSSIHGAHVQIERGIVLTFEYALILHHLPRDQPKIFLRDL